MKNCSSLMIYKFIEYIHCINIFYFQNSTNLSLVIKHLTRGCCLYSQRTSLPHPCPPQAEMAPGNKCWGGAKTARVPTASEASKIFTGHTHTFQIGLKCDYTLKKHNKQVTRVPTVHRNFQKFKCPRGGSVNFWGAPAPPSTPGRAIPAHMLHSNFEMLVFFARNRLLDCQKVKKLQHYFILTCFMYHITWKVRE